jgi:single-stranded-DNA-specific exonuclease
LYNRGIPIEELDHYYNTSYLDILDPLLLNNMREGAKMLIAHIGSNDKMYVQVDADCDGYTSSAVLINYLYRLFPNYVENNLTWGLHRAKEHGIDMEFVPSDVKLIVVPDASSNEYDLHKQLSE